MFLGISGGPGGVGRSPNPASTARGALLRHADVVMTE
jgi:hypothetical protein